MMDEFFSKLNAAAEAVGGIIAEHGPAAVDTTLTLIRVQSIRNLVGVVLLFAATWITWWLTRRLAKKLDEEAAIAFIPGILIAAGLLIAGVIELLSISTWLGLFDPALALAYRALHSAGLL